MARRTHTSQSQFELMVTFMERHGDLMKPTDGARGRARNAALWDELTTTLNSEGSGNNRTAEQWRKVWSDLKNNTKRKAARIHREANRTGGGPAYQGSLDDREERVMTIINMRSAVGLPNLEIGLEMDMQEVQSPPPPPESQQLSPPVSLSTLMSQELSIVLTEDFAAQQPTASEQTPQASALLLSQSAAVQPGTTPVSQAPRSAPPAPTAEAVPGTSRGRAVSPPGTPRRLRRRGVIGTPPGQLRRRMRQQGSHLDAATSHFLRSDAEWRQQINERERREEEREQRAEEREKRAEERQLRAQELETGWQHLFERLVAVAEKWVEKI